MIDTDINGTWKTALRLLDAIGEGVVGALNEKDRNIRIAQARDFIASSGIPRLARLSRLLVPSVSSRQLLAVIVPVERVVRREKITDAEMGISTKDIGERSPFPFTVIADNIRSAFNVGGIFRTADALGASDVWLCGYSPDPNCIQVCKASLGAESVIPWRHFDDIRSAVAEQRALGSRIYAAETAVSAVNCSEVDFKFPCALLLGSERFGLDPDVVADADEVVSVEMFGTKNSINVVSALAIIGYTARSQFQRESTK